jgi:predicted MFS family arabinose efflux permease
LLPVLGLSIFSVWLITIAFELLLIEIAATFQVSVGTAGLVAAVGSISGIAAGLVLAFLSVRFNHKLFLLFGLVCTCLSAVGFFLAPTFEVLLVVNIGVGTGIAMVSSMTYSFIGEFYPLHKRGKAMGWIVASSTLSFVVGSPIIGVIASISDWRATMLWLALPFALASLVLAYLIIPKESSESRLTLNEPFFEGAKLAFSNRSATASLFVTLLTIAEASVAFYAISFFRDQFDVGIDIGAVIMVVGNILLAVGGVAAGMVINRFGRKPLGTITGLLAALLTLTFTFMPTLGLSWGVNALRFWFAGMSSTALGSMVIEQLPKFRGTMSSLNTVFYNGGMLLATIVANFFIIGSDYQIMAVILGGLGVVGMVVWMAFVKDPSLQTK